MLTLLVIHALMNLTVIMILIIHVSYLTMLMILIIHEHIQQGPAQAPHQKVETKNKKFNSRREPTWAPSLGTPLFFCSPATSPTGE